MELKLMKCQQQLVEEFRKGNSVICNWSRGGGKTFMFSYLLLTERPFKVQLKSYNPVKDLQALNEKIKELFEYGYFQKENVSNINSSNNCIKIKYYGGRETNIIITEDNEKDYDWVFYNGQFPTMNLENETLLHKSISMVTRNNSNKRIQREYNCKVIESDIFDLVEEGLYDAGFIRKLLSEDLKSFYREWAILNKEETDTIEFKDFKIKAMQKLMKQFLSIQDTKDTVLTRKNIIEMIKDLDQLGIK